MPDVREELGRLAGEAGEPGGLDDLAATRRRRERRRRTTSLVGGITVLVVGSLIAIRLGGGLGGRIGVPGETESPAPEAAARATVWPENAINGMVWTDAQAALDGGDESLRWRTDPGQVVERFGQRVLGRGLRIDSVVHADRGVSITASPCPPGEEPVGFSCDAVSGDAIAFHLIQPGPIGANGIWSIDSVTSDSLRILVATGSETGVPEGSEVEVVVSQVPDGSTALVGIVGSNGCNVVHEATAIRGRAVIRVPTLYGADPSCAALAGGYAFAYVTEDGEFSRDPINAPTPGLAYPWMTVVPFAIDNTSASFAPTPTPSVSSALPSTSAPVVDCTSRTDVTVVEQGIALTGCQDWAAGEPIQLTFRIEDRGTQEGLELFLANQCADAVCSGKPVWSGNIDTGRAVVLYDVPALERGRYVLRDPVHPFASMQIDVS
jgi:hypothetical protein